MMRHALGKVFKVHQKILSGEVAAFPYRRKQESGCDYCAYRHICGFDQKIPGYKYRDIFEMTQSEVIAAMEADAVKENMNRDDHEKGAGERNGLMGVKWTKQQQQVIDLRDRNILVSAAAGSGKTAVLVERIITMLTDEEHPVNVDELLIVTFTEAAAGEMKERIRGAIEKALEENPENEHLKRQATLIHNAQITTIHSFCLSVIRDHFHVIDIDPGFRTAEEGELKLLRHDVLDELLEEKYAQKKKSGSCGFLMPMVEEEMIKKLEEMIEKAYDYSRSYPDGEGWLDSCVDAYRVDCAEDLEKSDYGNKIVTWAKAYLEEAKLLNEQATQISLEIDGPAVYEEALKLDAQTIRELLSAKNYNELSGRIQNVEWSRFASCRDKTVSKEKNRSS